MFESDLVELIDRQFQWVLELEGAAFIRQLQHCLDVLERDPRLAAIFEDLQREADELVASLFAYDSKASKEVVRLRHECVRLFPGADDSRHPPPGPNQHDADWPTTLGYFDRLQATRKPERPSTYELEDETLTKTLLGILRGKMRQPGPPRASEAEIEPFRNAFNELHERHQRVAARFLDNKLTSGAVALVALKNFLFAALDPVGLSLDPDWRAGTPVPRFSPVIPGGTPDFDLTQRNLTDDQRGELERAVEQHRPRVRGLYEELRLRIGTQRSLLSFMDRFQHRCQWHDRERLGGLADKAPGRPEAVLTAELARWFFDQGMSPLSEPMMAGLRPDLIDPSSRFNLYVEAKQYKNGARPYLIRGFHQLWDTVSGLKGTPYAVREAFYVVFRRGGPRYVLPERIEGEGWVAHLRLIDIAPAAQRGSRGAGQPEEISIDELRSKNRAVPGRGGQRGTRRT